jgi:hypothetical protein
MKRVLIFATSLFVVIPIVLTGCKSTEPNIEMRDAPIHEVSISIAESAPPQVFVYIKGGLSDGCTTFKGIEMNRKEDVIDIKVTVQRPKDKMCTQVYGFFEKNVALGSDFMSGRTYTVEVNSETKTFVMQ